MKVKEESEKVVLQLTIQKIKIMASGPITSWQIDGEAMEIVSPVGKIKLTLFWGAPKITADGDCTHEIKMLAPWKKSYDQPDSLLKSRDITLPTKVHLVKAIIFLVVMYRCESWTIKKAEC